MDSGSEDWEHNTIDETVAVVGMAGRYPESPNLEVFWENLRAGRDCLHTFSDEELDAFGVPASVYQRDNFIRRGTRLPEREGFDARFFGYTPKQAEVMDPQARIFLETCYETLEVAGYNPFDTGHSVGVFAGSNPNDYALLLGVADPTDSLSAFDQLIGLDRDFVATRVSHNLGLTGPAMTLQTACSTSLVTIHQAVQSLLGHECSMALAGGVSVNYRQGVGYFYQQGMILSPTGECRAFDKDAQGTTLGQGCGVVLLKRLEDAVADGDSILAVVRASAINNDGDDKLSYTAPSENGQALVIATAHALAGVESDSIGYVETHGTGTLIGDPIEIAALTRAFRPGTDRKQYCAIGSAKTNFGHTDAAAGVTGFIKTVLALHHREIPPSINFSEPNPDIDFANSPFFVNTELRQWPEGPTPRRAGVSAFGIGGTNAHIVLEEGPMSESRSQSVADDDRQRIVTVSAKTSQAAEKRLEDLADRLEREPQPMSAVDYTLRSGRPHFEHRRAVVVGDGTTVRDVLDGETDAGVVRGTAAPKTGPLVWLFAGQGAQYPRMGVDLYNSEPVFAEAIDRVAVHLEEPLGIDLRTLLLSGDEDAGDRLRETAITQPSLFAIEHAMSCLLRSWSVTPDVVIGHSIGEYAAAVEAGIMSWEDAATLVAERGRLMQSMDPGAMLSVGISADELTQRLSGGVELAASNSSSLSVASGSADAIDSFAAHLEAEDISAQILHTSHAFHSAMMEEAAAKFATVVAGVKLYAPSLPLISNVTGRTLTDQEATDPNFWASQIRRPVLFAQCLIAATEQSDPIFLEIGPGRALSTFASSHEQLASPVAVPTMRHPRQERNDRIVLKEAMARLWTAGHELDWDRLNGDAPARRVPLPPYPFERIEAWLPEHRHVLALPHFGPPSADALAPTSREPLDRWLYSPSWRLEPRGHAEADQGTTVILAPAGPMGDRLVERVAALGDTIAIRLGTESSNPDNQLEISSDRPAELTGALTALADEGVTVSRLIHAWTADPVGSVTNEAELENALDLGVHSLLACARGLSAISQTQPIRVDVLTCGAFSIMGDETIRPEAAALIGPVKVIPLEYSGLTTRMIDLPVGISSDADLDAALDELAAVPAEIAPDAVISLRNGRRWAPTVTVHPTAEQSGDPVLKAGGHYLIVGGLGGVGLSIARHLAENYQASLLLTSRRGRPVPSDDQDAETIKRLELLEEIEAMASSLEVIAVDAADESAMASILKTANDRLAIDGVIVAAGVADQQGAIHRRSRDAMTTSISAKVHSTLALERALLESLGGHRPDFVLLSSSIAATLYHNRFAQVGYVTGNAFAEAFAHRGRQQGLNMTTVAWDDWLDIGMSVRAAQDFAAGFGTDVDLVDQLNSFAPADGVVLFERALRSAEPVLLVSPTDLERRLADDVNVVSPFLEQATAGDETEVEQAETIIGTVSAVWTSLLGFESFEPTDHFFDLGGDSLQAARMADRLSRTFGCQVPVDRVFDAPVLADLSNAIEQLVAQGADDQTEAEQQFEDVQIPLGPAQHRFLARDTERPEHFNISVMLRPTEALSLEQLHAAVEDLIHRHSALRIRFVEDDKPTVQFLEQAESSRPLDVIDLSSLDPETVAAELEASATEVQHSLDLAQGPTVRAVLYQLPNQEQRLLLVVHHLVSDRVSLLLMLDYLDAQLKRLRFGQDLPEVRPETAYLAWVESQRRLAEGSSLDPQRAAWRAKPWDAIHPIPLDYPATVDANRNTWASAVEVEMSDAALETSGETRLDELVLLGLSTALARWGDQRAVLVDVMGHGRRLPVEVDVSGAAGMFITYSPTIVDFRTDDIEEQLAAIRSGSEDGWSFDALRLYGDSEIQAELNARPTADVLFNYVGRPIATDNSALLVPCDDPKGHETDQDGRRGHAIAVRADVLENGVLKLVFVYSTKLHDRATIEKLANSTVDAITAICMSRDSS